MHYPSARLRGAVLTPGRRPAVGQEDRDVWGEGSLPPPRAEPNLLRYLLVSQRVKSLWPVTGKVRVTYGFVRLTRVYQ